MRKEIRGYDPDAVDAFLARCLATPGIYRGQFPQLRDLAPRGQRVTAQEIRDVRFPKAHLGYQIRAVDALLDQLERAVELTTWRSPALESGAVQSLRRISLVDTPRASTARR